MLLAGAGMLPCAAAELDWSSVSWTSGTLSQSYSNVDGTTVDIDFTFPATVTTGNALYPTGTPSPSNGAFVTGSPEINTDLTTDDALYLELDFGAQDPNEYVTLEIDFSEEVTDVSLTAFDIDFNDDDFQDLVVVVGLTESGDFVEPTTLGISAGVNRRTRGAVGRAFFDDTIYDPNDPAVIRRSGIVGLTTQSTPDGGSGTWDFGDQEIVGLRLVYTNGRDGPVTPDGQAIALGNVSFTPVIPEAETYWAGGSLLFLLGFFEWRRRRRIA